MLSTFSEASVAEMELSGEPEGDLKVVQMIEATHLCAKSRGKNLKLSQPASGPLLDVQANQTVDAAALAAQDHMRSLVETSHGVQDARSKRSSSSTR